MRSFSGLNAPSDILVFTQTTYKVLVDTLSFRGKVKSRMVYNEVPPESEVDGKKRLR